MILWMRAAAAVLGILAAAACFVAGVPNALPALAVEPIAPPAASGLSVQLTAANGQAILSWIEGAGAAATLKFAGRTADGWSEPHPVASGERLIVNPADVPSVQALADGRLLAQWLEANGPDPEAYDLRVAWSSDAGRTWSPPVTPHDDRMRAQHGFASVFDTADGGFGLVWLDGREVAGGLIGDMGLRAAAYDRAGTQVDQTVVDSRVCECCQTSAAAIVGGAIVAYRDRSAAEIRDISVVRREGGAWTEPALVHDDGWQIKGCPVNGPAISARERDVAVAWFTVDEQIGRALIAFSRDGGRRFAAPVRIDDGGSAGRVQVALLDEAVAAVTWIETGAGEQAFKLRRIGADGGRSDATTVAGRMGRQYPRLARHGNELLLAWVEMVDGVAQLKTARAQM